MPPSRPTARLLAPAERAEIDRVAQKVKELIAGEDRDRIHAAMDDLDRATHDFAQKRMDRAIQMALKGQRLDEVEAGMATDGAQIRDFWGRSTGARRRRM